jgi:pilus assembly protein CpaF
MYRVRTGKEAEIMADIQEVKEELQTEIHSRLEMDREMTDEEIGAVIDTVIMNKSKEMYLSAASKLILRQDLFNAIRRLDLLQELVDDREITEIMVNGSDSIFYEKKGRITRWDKSFSSREKLQNVIRQIVSRSDRVVNESCPIVDARLRDGSRVNVVLDPVALNGPILTIRKFPEQAISMQDLIRWGSEQKKRQSI